MITSSATALRALLPGLDSLLVLDAVEIASVIARRPDVWVVIRAFLGTGIEQVEKEALDEGIALAAKRVESLWREGDTLADIVSHIRGEQP